MKKLTLEIYHYQLTVVVAVIMMLYGITFLTGYFWGKKSALEEFAEQIKNESFSDKVYASLCSLYDQPGDTPSDASGAPTEPAQVTEIESEEPSESTGLSATDNSQKLFVAHLIGYGMEKQAQAYVNALRKKGISAQALARQSRSAKGKTRTWFQVVTAPASYEDTQRVVERLAIEDRLAGVSIVEIGL